MTDWATARADLEGALSADFAANEPSIKLLFDNAPPLNPQPDPTAGDGFEWIRFKVLEGSGSRSPYIGERVAEVTGRAEALIHVRAASGLVRMNALKNRVRDLFQNQKVGTTRCFETDIVVAGLDDTNVWYREIASTRFDFENVPA